MAFDKFKKSIKLSISSAAINALIDSNKSIVALNKFLHFIDDDFIDVLTGLSFDEYEKKNLKGSLEWIEIAYQVALLKGSPLSLAKCLTNKCFFLLEVYYGELHEVKKDNNIHHNKELGLILKDALNNIDRAIQIFQELRNEEELSFAYCLKGKIYNLENDFPNAFDFVLKSILNYSLANINTSVLSNSISDLVGYYEKLHEDALIVASQKIVEIHDFLLDKINPIVNDTSQTYIYTILGIAFEKYNEKERASIYWKTAVNKCNTFLMCYDLQLVAYKFGSVEGVIIFGEKCLIYIESAFDDFDIAICLYKLAFAYRIQNRYDLSIETYNRAANYYSRCKSYVGHDSGNCLVRIAEIEKERGNIQQAINILLDSEKGSHGTFFYWHVNITLAILYSEVGDFVNAISRSEKATSWIHSSTSNNVFVAFSLNLTAFFYYRLGDYQKAFEKLKLLFEIIERTELESATYYPTDLESPEVVVSPSLGSTVYFLTTLSKKLSKNDVSLVLEYENFHKLLLTLNPEDFGAKFPNSFIERAGDEYNIHRLTKGLQLLSFGEKFILLDLNKAESCIKECVPMIDNTEKSPYSLMLLGIIEMLKVNFSKAIYFLQKSLTLYEKFPNLIEEMDCHNLLATLHYFNEDFKKSYKYSSYALEICEKLRSKITDIELRLKYAELITPMYINLIRVCTNLEYKIESFYMLEKSKSKVLLDLLNQPQRKIIDYASLSAMAQLKKNIEVNDQKMMIESFMEKKERHMKLDFTFENNSIDASEKIDFIKERLLTDFYFIEIDSQFEALNFEEIKELCTLSI